MRTFVFLSLIGAVFAAPQGGYNYQAQPQYNTLQQYAPQQFIQQQQPQLQQLPQGVQFGQVENFVQAQPEQQHIEQLQPQVQQQPQLQPVVQQQPQLQPVVQQQPQLQPVVQQNYQPEKPRQPTIQYNKEFFYLSAPKEDFEEPLDLDNPSLSQLKKNIRVLFIRTPEQKLSSAAIKLVKQAMDQRTVVYVLTKQHTAAELASKIQSIPNNGPSKPEVVFIKYRTPEEANQAQRQIQSQYDALDGPSRFHHDGPVSTHNFIGSISKDGVDPRSNGENAKAEEPSSQYLPADLRQ